MCQLLGINSQQRFDITPLLADFFKRGGQTDNHADGWGLAAFDPLGDVAVIKQDAAAAHCEKARQLLRQPHQYNQMIAHIRKATYGKCAVENTQPFHRSLWGQDWTYAHNGDLHNYQPTAHPLFTAKGETDSEKAFCQLLSALRQKFDLFRPKLDVLLPFLKQISDGIATFGNFNYLLGNNHLLIAYASSELYWCRIRQPQLPIALVDSRRNVSSIHLNQDNSIILVATKPIIKGEVWYPMGPGEIRLFSEGRVISAIEAEPQNVNRKVGKLAFI